MAVGVVEPFKWSMSKQTTLIGAEVRTEVDQAWRSAASNARRLATFVRESVPAVSSRRWHSHTSASIPHTGSSCPKARSAESAKPPVRRVAMDSTCTVARRPGSGVAR